ncbi:hypothetical protein BH10PSE9_BH10PSE9_10250 [soil metagenome]
MFLFCSLVKRARIGQCLSLKLPQATPTILELYDAMEGDMDWWIQACVIACPVLLLMIYGELRDLRQTIYKVVYSEGGKGTMRHRYRAD